MIIFNLIFQFNTPENAKSLTNELSELSNELAQRKTEAHFALLGKGTHGPNDDGVKERKELAILLVSNGLKHVSVIRNGFLGCHEYSLIGKVELSGHSAETCPLCINKNASFTETVASYWGTFSKTLASKVGSLKEGAMKVSILFSYYLESMGSGLN